MESSFTSWEIDVPLHTEPGTEPVDETAIDQDGECPTSMTEDTSQFSENSLEIKMRDMMNLDTTGHDYVILQQSCVETGWKEEEFKYLEEEPKMCNEKTATYWTGGGAEILNQEDFPAFIDDTKFDVGETDPHLTVQMEPVQSNAKFYLPLKKTLRNLRLLDMKLKYNSQQLTTHPEHPVSECNNDSASSSDESDSKFPEPRERDENPQGNDGEADNMYLIDLLSQCQFKLEQMEELKHYCRKILCNLWEAQETIEYLKDKVAELHRENVRKEEDIFLLTEEVMKCRSLLCQKSEKFTDVKTKLTQTGDHGESRQIQHEFASIYKINDQIAENTKPTEKNVSKTCVIL
ncbi:uncharacterized protein LOC130275800 [Hyla sarda]|uniref:uncharacterized protein LOC130275800 n=1 Tax=Hyla sarda TaxID=327740 RepID=UPI0024C393E3|nr:uncharacterized protein LOC130275800 [Hyla sarda]XP_056380200.1 uncharacterized protein LOC130275800 [Hyla sarda]XP_056380201.1 uncharacterized protein LOC130275800 [Hyla sarda]XP_056380202.1 uncharacterized protein LOC130275800 [Hyla sarda]XP_056380203.1 uncharacterized protein LOC130275800 [Hyla sarda]XP_056380204.1 uncharacterized protein LOC130275800 [Hyla sarda]XP_056380205.1 uncharacterized protein LOC130275800 [Hyla sarda]XP_056380206.1 uncharacterized protein LOC130275800 [Hyla sa